jgi:adenylate cyclase
MQRKSKILYQEWFFVIFAWLIIFYLYYFVAYWGMQDLLEEGVIREYLFSWHAHLEVSLQAVLFGMLFNVVGTVADKTWISRMSFGKIILIKSILYSFSVILAGCIVFLVFYIFELKPIYELKTMTAALTFPLFISVTVYIVFAVLLINFFLQVNRKFGPGNLLKLSMGKYHQPKNEKKIFLFLDLKNSTGITEQLGNNRYSQLLQNCFQDLTDIVLKYRADIYQYVGDEVVLTWDIKNVVKNLNCIKLFFAYELKLQSKRHFYLHQYDILPEFRGGMDMGSVTVAEVGELKREIAYHGDVLNTASRIQGKCKDFNKKLLISEHIIKEITNLDGFEIVKIKDVMLSGKQNPLDIYAIGLI